MKKKKSQFNFQRRKEIFSNFKWNIRSEIDIFSSEQKFSHLAENWRTTMTTMVTMVMTTMVTKQKKFRHFSQMTAPHGS